MNATTAKKQVIVLGLTVAVAGALALYHALTPEKGNAHYAELLRLARSCQRAGAGQSLLLERVASLAHFSSPSEYCRAGFDARRQALIASGYLVKVTVPVSDLRKKLAQVRVSLSNKLQQTGAYHEAELDHTRDEVRLVCRQQDVSLWQETIRIYGH